MRIPAIVAAATALTLGLGGTVAIGLTAAALLIAWGVFVRLNRSVEELEPEAMAQVKEEDEKLNS